MVFDFSENFSLSGVELFVTLSTEYREETQEFETKRSG